MSLIRGHPAVGAKLLDVVNFGKPVQEIIQQHHERIDGSGYPDGLVGADTLSEARITAVADVVEAMASHRTHGPARGIDSALSEIEGQKSVLYE